MTAPTQAAALLTRTGAELLEQLRGEMITPERAMRLTEELRGRYPAGLVAAALTQQSLRIAAREKFSRADEMYFTRAGLEQASAEVVARHNARRFAGLTSVADLCCGIGGDLTALASRADRVLAVDADLETLRFAQLNVTGQTSATISFLCADVERLAPAILGAVAGIFIEPARQKYVRRVSPGEWQPPLAWCLELTSRSARVGIKAAPGLPHEVVPPDWEAEFVAVGRGLKEALLWSPALASAPRRATVLPGGDTLVPTPGERVPVADPGTYLLDPNPAVTRAGLVQDLARALGAWQIDPMIAFLSVDSPVATPFARTLRILDSQPWHEKQATRRLRELDIGAADIRRRGLAGDVERIHRRLGLRGDRRATIVITRRDGKPWGLICEDVAENEARATDPR